MYNEIRQTWHLPHAPEIVWQFLTDSELLAGWLMKNDFKPEVGHQFRFYTKPKVKVGFDGTVYCKVLEVVPFKKLSYSWRGGPGNGKVTLDSVVCWTLKEIEDGTELLLEHTGFKGVRNYLPYIFMSTGWMTRIRKRLLERLNDYRSETAHH